MHRARILASSALGAAMLLTSAPAAFATPLNLRDVPTGDPDRMAIEFLNRHEVVYGYVDGTFRPDANITRGEILKIALEASGEGRAAFLAPSSGRYGDVTAGHTLGAYISYAAEKGYISGYDDGTFRPDANVNRAEATKIVANILHETDASESVYTDVAGSTLKPFIDRLYAANWYRPAPPIFNPDLPLTRREMARMTYRALVASANNLAPYADTMMPPATAASDWQMLIGEANEAAAPAGWYHLAGTEDVEGIPTEILAAAPTPITESSEAPAFAIVSIDPEDLPEDEEDPDAQDQFTEPVSRRIALDGNDGPQTVTVLEAKSISDDTVMVSWMGPSGRIYFAYYFERQYPGMRGAFDRFLQHAIELNGIIIAV